eukprot:scaffold134054_cov22-Tisochrysis_lutea.AAC.1
MDVSALCAPSWHILLLHLWPVLPVCAPVIAPLFLAARRLSTMFYVILPCSPGLCSGHITASASPSHHHTVPSYSAIFQCHITKSTSTSASPSHHYTVLSFSATSLNPH